MATAIPTPPVISFEVSSLHANALLLLDCHTGHAGKCIGQSYRKNVRLQHCSKVLTAVWKSARKALVTGLEACRTML